MLPTAPTITGTPDATALLVDRVVRLKQSHRSGPSIMAVAAVVNVFTEERAEELFALLSAGSAACCWEDAVGETAPQWWARLSKWAAGHYQDKSYRTAVQQYRAPNASTAPCNDVLMTILRQVTQAKILSAIHGGRYGCDSINTCLADAVRPIWTQAGKVAILQAPPS